MKILQVPDEWGIRKVFEKIYSKSAKGKPDFYFSWEMFQKLKIPSRYFEESVLRKHGRSLTNGSTEIRFIDLYEREEE